MVHFARGNSRETDKTEKDSNNIAAVKWRFFFGRLRQHLDVVVVRSRGISLDFIVAWRLFNALTNQTLYCPFKTF